MKETLFCPRALIPYLKKYIPGEPAIVIEHKQGAAGRTAVNHIYSGTKPDGLTIGAVGNVLVSGPILGLAGSNYDLDKLSGSTESGSPTAFVMRTITTNRSRSLCAPGSVLSFLKPS